MKKTKNKSKPTFSKLDLTELVRGLGEVACPESARLGEVARLSCKPHGARGPLGSCERGLVACHGGLAPARTHNVEEQMGVRAREDAEVGVDGGLGDAVRRARPPLVGISAICHRGDELSDDLVEPFLGE